MQVFHTAGVPPSSGSTILAIIGWTKNRSVELRNSVTASRIIICRSGVRSGKRDAASAIQSSEPPVPFVSVTVIDAPGATEVALTASAGGGPATTVTDGLVAASV